MNKGIVNKIIPFSSVDGPGNRTAIFLQGCNFDCLYCHNPETINRCINCGKCVDKCPYDALSMKDGIVYWDYEECKNCDECLKACDRNSSPKTRVMSVQHVVNEVKKLKAFISGITVSGGECSLQLEFITELFKEMKKLGLTAYMDTNGSTPLWNKEELLSVMDKAMIDVKSFHNNEHEKLTGQNNKNVIKNLIELSKMNKVFEVRTVIVPDVLDNERNVYEISKLIALLNSKIRYKIIKYRAIGVRQDIISSYTPSDEFMEKLKAIALNNGCEDVLIV